jgi:uncharacterized protein (TIGR03437 family)
MVSIFSCARPVAYKAPVPLRLAPEPIAAEAPRADSWREAADFFRFKRWPFDSELPVERYLEAEQHARSLPLYSIAEGRVRVTPTNGGNRQDAATRDAIFGTWQPLGPGNIGGRVRDLVIHPQNPNLMYAGTATGGVWKTTDGGLTWTPLTDFLPVLSVSSLAMSPADPNTLLVGTGEASRGAGIFKSTDAGQTWTQLKSTANLFYVYKLAYVRTRPNNVYAATSSGVWMSLDGGNSWKQSFPASGSGVSCGHLAVRSDQPTDIVFANCYTFVNSTYMSAIYRNSDAAGAGTWDSVLTDPNMDAVALAVAPTQSSTVYALAVNHDQSSPFRSALLAFYRSTSGGDKGTWEVRTSNSDPNPVNPNILSYPTCAYSPTDHHGQGGYNLDIAVDPTEPNRIFTAGIDLFRSDDGGATWGHIDGGGGKFAHSDQHILVFHPNYNAQGNQTLFVGNDGGVFRTDSALAPSGMGPQAFCFPYPAQVGWTGLNNGFVATQFYHGIMYAGGIAYFGGTQDNGTVRGTDFSGPQHWSSLYGGDGGDVAVDPLDANTLFYEYINLSIRKSVDGGVTNVSSVNGITENPKDFQFINYFVMDPADSLRLYTGGQSLWRSLDGGATWSAASAPLPDYRFGLQAVTTITVSPADPNVVYFGTVDGRIYLNGRALSANASTQWTYSRPGGSYVSRIVVDPRQPATVYAVYSSFRNSDLAGQIFKSMDGGYSWIPLNGSGSSAFPDVPSHVLLIDPNDSSRLYVGTDIGVFVSLDGGASWMRDDNPFANVITESLLLDQNGGTTSLYAFTYGRGTWRVVLPGSSGTCAYSLSASTLSMPASGGVVPIDISTNSNCRWAALPGSNFATLQSPASGQGPGRVFVVAKFNGATAPRNDTLYIQNQPVVVNQAGDPTGAHNIFSDELATARQIDVLPYTDSLFNRPYTRNPQDPNHTCTNSQDYKTAWWKFSAAASGRLLVTATGRRYDVYGDTGLVLSAYPINAGLLGAEAACATIPRTTSDPTSVSIQLDVAAGSSYAIEVSAIGPADTDGGFVNLSAAILPTVGLSPPVATVMAGAKQQFTANVNYPNGAVRWTLSPPLGNITQTGAYSAPLVIDTPTNVSVIAQSLANPVAKAAATVTIMPPPVSFSLAGITNAASFHNGAVAPGEIITIFGTDIGPPDLVGLQLDQQGRVSTSIGNTRVLFDGVAAPLVYSSFGQVAAIVPYEVDGHQNTQVQIEHNGQKSQLVSVPVTASAPALFTSSATGSGQAAVLNQDNLLNAIYAAPRGSVVVLFGTGEGQTIPLGVNGLVANTTFPKPVLPVSVQIGGQDAQVLYAGAAPTLVAGVLQVNAVVPTGIQPGSSVPVVVKVGDVASSSNVTLNVLGPDGRMARVAYNNLGASSVKITVYDPSRPQTPIVLGTVPAGKYYIVNALQVGNDWGIQVNSSAIRVISHVCDYAGTASPPYWACAGTADNPFPR